MALLFEDFYARTATPLASASASAAAFACVLCLCALPAPVELFMVIGKIFLCVFLFAGNKTKALSANTTLERDTLGPLQLRLQLRLQLQLELELEWLVVIMQFSSLFAEGATFRP